METLPNLDPGDIVVLPLGCIAPLLLRPTTVEGQFEVVDECYVQGVMNGEAVLGPLPSDWKRQIRVDIHGLKVPYFKNTKTGETSPEDPRLGPLPSEWERMDIVRNSDDPLLFTRFRHRQSGEVINSDPRCTASAWA